MSDDIQEEITSEAVDESSSSSGSMKPGNPKKPKNYKHYDLKEILRRFNLTKDEWHRIIKPGILKWLSDNIDTFSEDAQKAYKQLGNNPDFYFSSDGYIQIVSVRGKATIELLKDIYYFILELLNR